MKSVALEEHPDCVEVNFRHAPMRRFDLVVGADGLHSNVRKLAFGPEESFERRLGYIAAAFEVPGYRPRDEGGVCFISTVARERCSRGLRYTTTRTLFLFVFASGKETYLRRIARSWSAEACILHEQFGGELWECRHILAGSLIGHKICTFDRVSQITVESWSRGRVVLVGDAAFCISLTGGQGSAFGNDRSVCSGLSELGKAHGAH